MFAFTSVKSGHIEQGVNLFWALPCFPWAGHQIRLLYFGFQKKKKKESSSYQVKITSVHMLVVWDCVIKINEL